MAHVDHVSEVWPSLALMIEGRGADLHDESSALYGHGDVGRA
jgi:hypothetical protein